MIFNTSILNNNITYKPLPKSSASAINVLFTAELFNFVIEAHDVFHKEIDKIYQARLLRKCMLQNPDFSLSFKKSVVRSDKTWRVSSVPERLINRRLDLGDVSPTNLKHFTNALNANVQGIQVDFDDGHCPSWKNQIDGLYNVYRAVHNQLPNVPFITSAPILMLRPRAWNMIEDNFMIRGQTIPGPLFDFAILVFHNGKILAENKSGPFFYLSKIESSEEAKLWNSIFVWTQNRLNIPQGTIKACVLIENIFASFEMDEILYELREHSLGLNCGIWDYAASIICKFGNDKKFLIPDRSKYVNMDKTFLKKYMQLVIRTCHSRGAHATGGMAAGIIQNLSAGDIMKIVDAKKREIIEGVDGFMVYDISLVPYMNKLWKEQCEDNPNQINRKLTTDIIINESDLLEIPKGGVTINGLKNNIIVTIMFIYHWLNGNGHYFYNKSVEDSATAEISRSQIWQWIRHQAKIEDTKNNVTISLVEQMTFHILRNIENETGTIVNRRTLFIAVQIFFDLITMKYFPDFITSYLYRHYMFKQSQQTYLQMFKSNL